MTNKTAAPNRALAVLFGAAVIVLIIFYFLNVNLETAILIPSGASILVYVIGSCAGIRLLKENGPKKLLPIISLVISLAILPFVGALLSASIVITVLALIYSMYTKRGIRRRRDSGSQKKNQLTLSDDPTGSFSPPVRHFRVRCTIQNPAHAWSTIGFESFS